MDGHNMDEIDQVLAEVGDGSKIAALLKELKTRREREQNRVTVTVTICIGNTDNKLSQGEFAHFVEGMKQAIEAIVWQVHFFGGTTTFDPWQTVCWVVEVDEQRLGELKSAVTKIRNSFQQHSAALTVGKTEFI